jgi:hypothetical protein
LGSDLPWDMISFYMQVEENLNPLLQDTTLRCRYGLFLGYKTFVILLLWEKIAKNLETQFCPVFFLHIL